MPKRSLNDKIDRYQRKIRKLEEKQERDRLLLIADSSGSENKSDDDQEMVTEEVPLPDNEEPLTVPEVPASESSDIPSEKQKPEDTVPELDPDIILALGESTEDLPKFGENIHDSLSRLWTPILRKGLNKELKEKTMKQFLVPENCSLLQAPKLNPEISAAVSDATRNRDKRVESVQQQLGVGITALNRALTLLLEGNDNKLEIIKLLSESSRILCDLHHVESQARMKFITPGLDKSFSNIVQDVERDEMLFGKKLSEKIKASRVIEKQGLQIKKSAPAPKSTPSNAQASTSRSRPQGNWAGPPRYPSNRGGRGGTKKTSSAGSWSRKAPSSTQSRTSFQNKPQRAPTQQQ